MPVMPFFKQIFFFFALTWVFLPLEAEAQSWNKADYAGYRCAIMQVQDVRVDDRQIRFTCSLANTGRERLLLDKSRPALTVVFTSDGSLDNAALQGEQELVAMAILTSGIQLQPGEMASRKKFEIRRDFTLPIAVDPDQDDSAEEKVGGLSPDVPAHTGATEKVFVPLIDPDRAGCPDLVVDSLWVIATGRKSMQVAVRLANRGDGPATLYTADRQDKGMGISFYFGTSDRISRGSLFIQGEHVAEGLDGSHGELLPGESLIKEVKVDTRRHTRFLTALQCRLDTFQQIVECDETNNEFIHFLR